ncbi:MAG: hypothetical protein MI921_00585 [Cytophagales bacterium]|nr:hypothetical protein [Cytophagales bacterium]
MISPKIKLEIEKSPLLQKVVDAGRYDNDWSKFTRTFFERIARKINTEVTKRVVASPYLVKEYLLFGEDEFENIVFKHKLSGMDDFIGYLQNFNVQKPYLWISGKTLQAYWNNGNAKDKKLNVLLTFLDVELSQWDNWKNFKINGKEDQKGANHNDRHALQLLKKYYKGNYYRYYQKTDGSQILIKAPFIIREDSKEVVVIETKTVGHRYKNSTIAIRDGALYVDCENLDWNEKESYIFNIGFETNPELIFGVSNTLDKRGRALAIKNILVKNPLKYDFSQIQAIEIPFNQHFEKPCADSMLLDFFRKSQDNLIKTQRFFSFNDLSSITDNQVMHL